MDVAADAIIPFNQAYDGGDIDGDGWNDSTVALFAGSVNILLNNDWD